MQNSTQDAIQLRTATLDDKEIAYSSETEFLVQVGRGSESYKTKWTIKGNLAQAIIYYKGLNVHSGKKKRLLMPSSPNPVLARYISTK